MTREIVHTAERACCLRIAGGRPFRSALMPLPGQKALSGFHVEAPLQQVHLIVRNGVFQRQVGDFHIDSAVLSVISMLVARTISIKRALLIQVDINVQRNHFLVSVYFLICCSTSLSCLTCSGFTAGPACFKRLCSVIPAIIFCRLAFPWAASATSPRLARA